MKIYIIDNHLTVLHTLESFLSELGHEVLALNSIDKLLNDPAKSKKPIDLILMNSFVSCERTEAIQKVHELYPDAPIVLMTDYYATIPSEKAISMGLYAYLRKPISLRELELLLVQLKQNGKKSQLQSLDNGESCTVSVRPVMEERFGR